MTREDKVQVKLDKRDQISSSLLNGIKGMVSFIAVFGHMFHFFCRPEGDKFSEILDGIETKTCFGLNYYHSQSIVMFLAGYNYSKFSSRRNRSSLDYFIQRLRRFARNYYFGLILGIIAFAIHKDKGYDNVTVNDYLILGTIVGYMFFLSVPIEMINGASWQVSFLAVFSIFMPFTHNLLTSLTPFTRRILYHLCWILFVPTLILGFTLLAGSPVAAVRFFHLNPILRYAQCVMGMITSMSSLEPSSNDFSVNLLGGILFIYTIFPLFINMTCINYSLVQLATQYFPIFGIFTQQLLQSQSCDTIAHKILLSRVFQYLGNISFEWNMLHWGVSLIMIELLHQGRTLPVNYFLIPAFVSIALAHVAKQYGHELIPILVSKKFEFGFFTSRVSRYMRNWRLLFLGLIH